MSNCAERILGGPYTIVQITANVVDRILVSNTDEDQQKLDMPLLIIAAGKSNVMNLGVGAFAKSAKELSERKPNSTYILVPDSKHYIQAEQPQILIDAIETWLTTLR